MRKTVLTLLLLALMAATRPAAAADTDLLQTKVQLGLAGLADAVASEADTTPDHAARLELANAIAEDLERFTSRFLPRILKAYPTSADVCYADSLTRQVNCANGTTQAEVFNQVVALFSNSLKLRASQAAPVALQQLDIQGSPAEDVVASKRR
jgi:hypothetical protein